MLSHSACIAHLTQSQNSSLYKVVGVRRTFRLSENVLDTNTFQYGTHSTTGYNSGTFRSGEDEHLSTTEASSLLVGNSTFEYGNLNQIFLSCLYTFSNSGGNFASLTKAITDDTVTITYYYDSSESECTTTLGYFDNTIDSNQSILNSSVFTFTLFAII